MPRRLENDRWLFGVTLGLCLLGAVMIFSASAVTAEHEYGHSYFFLLRQSAWLAIGLAGMFLIYPGPGNELVRRGILLLMATVAVVAPRSRRLSRDTSRS